MIQPGLIIYLLETAFCLVVCLGIYRWVLKGTGSFRLRKLYLVIAPVLSSVIPLMHVHFDQGRLMPIIFLKPMPWMADEQHMSGMERTVSLSTEFILSAGNLLLAVYGMGVLFLSVAFLKGLLNTLKSVRRMQQMKRETTSSGVPGPLPACSLFSSLYWFGDRMRGPEKDFYLSISDQIKPYHALEVVMIELMVVFGWFLPMIWAFRNRLRELHVIESDRYAVHGFDSREGMVRYLLGEHKTKEAGGLSIHPLFPQRIGALQKPGSEKRTRAASWWLVVPVFAGLVWLFGTPDVPVPFLDRVFHFLGEEVESLLQAELVHLDAQDHDQVYMEWSGKEVPLVHIEDQTEIRFPFHEFSPDQFRKFQTQLPVIYRQDGTICDIEKVRISITASDHQNFYNLECPGTNMKCLHEAMEGMPATSSIQLVFMDREEQQYYCILTDEAKTLYIPNRWYIEDPFIFDKPPALKSYGVERMSRISPKYEVLWGPQLRFGLDHPEPYPVHGEAMAQALTELPALTPIHGGVIDRFAFDLRYASRDGEELKVHLVVDQLDPEGFIKNPFLQMIGQNLIEGDILFVEQVQLADGREIGGFSTVIAEHPRDYGRRKWNLANFNFSEGKRSLVQNQLTESPDAYVLKWGTYFIPLELFASPNQYKGGLDMETAQFADLLEYPMEIYRNNEKLPSSGVERSLKLIYHHSSEMSLEQVAILASEGEMRVKKQDLAKVARLARPGQRLSLTGEVAGIRLNALEIDLIDPDSPYRPSVHIPIQHTGSGEYPFQVIQGVGDQKTVIKIDSASASAREILEMYRDDRKYEIIQIPGFRTSRRLITPDIKAFGSRAILLGSELTDIHFLKEYRLHMEDDAMMKWGRMIANPVSGNYSAREFQYSGRWPLRLVLNSEKMDVLQMEVKLYSGEKLAHHFKVSQLDHPVLQKAIQSIPSRGAVLITNIVVNVHGQPVLFPQDFAFFVE